MKKLLTIVAAAAVALATASAIAQDEDEPNYKYRNNIMKGVSAHAGSIAMIAKGQVAHTGHLSAHASALEALANQTLAAFKQKSTGGKSRAKDEIWSDWGDFEAKVKDFQMASAAVAEAANSGDASAVGGKLGALFDTCKGCHKKYRAAKE